ncbi:hypothetical protein ACET3Z_029068 [Daucus carota]
MKHEWNSGVVNDGKLLPDKTIKSSDSTYKVLGLLLDEMLLELVCYWLFPVFLEAFNKIYSHGFSATDTKFVALSNMYYYEFWINICKALLIVAMTYI